MIIRHTTTPSGPGNNIFLKENVIHGQNNIILRTKKKETWTCAEVRWSAEEGIYEFDLEVPCLPRGIICGVFLYQDDAREIDIEFGRWNSFFKKDCQFVKQQSPPERFWNLKKNNHIKVEYQKNFAELTLNGKVKRYTHDFRFDFFIVNLWIYGQPAKAEVKIKNFNIIKKNKKKKGKNS